jgi:hypothetical protein
VFDLIVSYIKIKRARMERERHTHKQTHIYIHTHPSTSCRFDPLAPIARGVSDAVVLVDGDGQRQPHGASKTRIREDDPLTLVDAVRAAVT